MATLNVPDVTSPVDRELDEVFRGSYRMTYGTAYGVPGSAEDAEHVVQTIFLRHVCRELPPDLLTNPGAYLYRSPVNLSLRTIRGRKRRQCNSHILFLGQSTSDFLL